MNNNKRIPTVILIILICLNIGFIWWNSFQVSDVSNSVSDTVADAVKPVVDPIVKPITSDDGTIFGYKYNAFIRKMAHVLEFMMLGALLVLLKNSFKRISISTILFVALATAVADETIQIFNGRTDSVKDIVIDFCGSVAGMVLATGIIKIIGMVRSRICRKKVI